MLRASVVSVALSGCILVPQALESPCADLPVSEDVCPACNTDADCGVLSNPCHASAICVPSEGNWGVTADGCLFLAQRAVPAASRCRCVDSVCQGD